MDSSGRGEVRRTTPRKRMPVDRYMAEQRIKTRKFIPVAAESASSSSSDEEEMDERKLARKQHMKEDPDNVGLVNYSDGEEEWKVEQITRKKDIDGVPHYRIKWEGWPS